MVNKNTNIFLSCKQNNNSQFSEHCTCCKLWEITVHKVIITILLLFLKLIMQQSQQNDYTLVVKAVWSGWKLPQTLLLSIGLYQVLLMIYSTLLLICELEVFHGSIRKHELTWITIFLVTSCLLKVKNCSITEYNVDVSIWEGLESSCTWHMGSFHQLSWRSWLW